MQPCYCTDTANGTGRRKEKCFYWRSPVFESVGIFSIDQSIWCITAIRRKYRHQPRLCRTKEPSFFCSGCHDICSRGFAICYCESSGVLRCCTHRPGDKRGCLCPTRESGTL